MSDVQKRYIGLNGLEYLNEFDAEKYGEGLSHIMEYTPPKRVEIRPEAVAHVPEKLGGIGSPIGSTAKIPSNVQIPSTEVLEDAPARVEALDKLDTVDQWDEITVRQRAKELGVKSWHVTNLEKLRGQVKAELEKSLA